MLADRRHRLLLLIALVLVNLPAAHAEEGCIYGDCQNGYGTREIAGERIWRGTFEQGTRHGYGHEESAAGDEIWQGSYLNGGLNGKALFVAVKERSSTVYYLGTWKAGKRDGYGIYVNVDWGRYSGGFVDGVMQGEGEYVGTHGDRYTGTYFNDRWDGIGTLTIPDVLRYTGSWKAGLRVGEGEENFFDGTFEYRGGYRADKPSGTGTVYMDGREIHRGPVDPEHGYGFGARKDEGGGVYVGELLNGRPHGRGALARAGDVRTGLWVDGVRREAAPDPPAR
jgi:hypothetical protein